MHIATKEGLFYSDNPPDVYGIVVVASNGASWVSLTKGRSWINLNTYPSTPVQNLITTVYDGCVLGNSFYLISGSTTASTNYRMIRSDNGGLNWETQVDITTSNSVYRPSLIPVGGGPVAQFFFANTTGFDLFTAGGGQITQAPTDTTQNHYIVGDPGQSALATFPYNHPSGSIAYSYTRSNSLFNWDTSRYQTGTTPPFPYKPGYYPRGSIDEDNHYAVSTNTSGEIFYMFASNATGIQSYQFPRTTGTTLSYGAAGASYVDQPALGNANAGGFMVLSDGNSNAINTSTNLFNWTETTIANVRTNANAPLTAIWSGNSAFMYQKGQTATSNTQNAWLSTDRFNTYTQVTLPANAVWVSAFYRDNWD